jgi:hypothetical protein
MPSAITSVTQSQPVAQPTVSSQKSAPTKPQSTSTSQDSVQLSSTAQAALAALAEATETPAQTVKEAGTGDLQAQRLLAKETAASKSAQQ